MEVISVKTVGTANLRTPPCVFVPQLTEEMNARVPRADVLRDQFRQVSWKIILAQNMEDIRDPIIQKVVEQFISRSNVGFKKYKITLDEDSKTTYEWLQNIQEELMDAVNYIEKLKSVIKIKR